MQDAGDVGAGRVDFFISHAGADRAWAEWVASQLRDASNLGDSGDPAGWPGWAQLLPHILAIDPAASNDPAVRELACNATWYLLMRGDIRSGHDLAKHLY